MSGYTSSIIRIGTLDAFAGKALEGGNSDDLTLEDGDRKGKGKAAPRMGKRTSGGATSSAKASAQPPKGRAQPPERMDIDAPIPVPQSKRYDFPVFLPM